LIVTPAGQSLLVDAGFPGIGTFAAKPGELTEARDARRIAAAARDAGVARIDYLLITHFHADHDGGVVELARELPIGTFIDHGTVLPAAEESVPGTLEMFKAYAAVRAKGRHLEPKPGDRLPLTGIEAIVVSAAGATLVKPLPGGGRPTPKCGTVAPPAQEPQENPRSTGFRLQFGKFRFLDLGDLTGAPLFALVCPTDLVGPVDVYLVAHHGGLDAADPATFAAFTPRVAVINNGSRKGGAPEIFAALRSAAGIEDVWQLHRSRNEGAANFADDRIANLDETTAHWIKLSASEDGSFTVTNGRTGETKKYAARP
jgi:competence protein ComEC